jgi:hypothetical protein
MRRITWIVAGVLTLALSAGAAGAGDQSPPELDLRSRGEHLQNGQLWSYCWSFNGGSGCGDGVHGYPPSRLVERAQALRIRMRISERPDAFLLTRHHELDEEGQPIDDGKRVRRDLKKVWRNGKVVAWDAVFRLFAKDKHYYLTADTRWSRGDAAYDFHVKTKP